MTIVGFHTGVNIYVQFIQVWLLKKDALNILRNN